MCNTYYEIAPRAAPRLQFGIGQLDKSRAYVMIDEHDSAKSYEA